MTDETVVPVPLHSLIPFEDFSNFLFTAILGLDNQEYSLGRQCLATMAYTMSLSQALKCG
jgi:hypothetical protein